MADEKEHVERTDRRAPAVEVEVPALDKSYALPGMTIAFLLSLLAVAFYGGKEMNAIESDMTALRVEISDISDRQGKYIGQGGSLTQDVETLEERLTDLRIWLAAQHTSTEIP